MKLPTESKEWHKIDDGIWERMEKVKDKNSKSGFRIMMRIYHEIVCEQCDELAIAAKDKITRGNGCFCSHRCATQGMKGAKNSNWKGGRKINHGYVLLKKYGHSNADEKGYVAEHRLVMSEELGRSLRKGELVHHENEDRQDNDLSNLKVMTRGEHNAVHRGG